jgi:glycosyltransferase Alg8
MWTSLLGLVASVFASIKYSTAYFAIYLLWILLTRLILTALLKLSGHNIGPVYPIMLYYNQIVGSLMKIYVFFRLDQQSWTRQNTRLKRSSDGFQAWFNHWSTKAYTFSSASIFLAFVLFLV